MINKLARRDLPIDLEITIFSDIDRFREQRTWRFCFGLYQDVACVGWSKGFKKMPDVPFVGKIRPSCLPQFVREVMPMVVADRAEVRINGDLLRRRLLDVMTS